MSAARTGPAAPSTRKQTVFISIPTQPCLRCRTSPRTSRCQAQRTRRPFCIRPPNLAKTKWERLRGQAELAEAQLPDPEDLRDSEEAAEPDPVERDPGAVAPMSRAFR